MGFTKAQIVAGVAVFIEKRKINVEVAVQSTRQGIERRRSRMVFFNETPESILKDESMFTELRNELSNFNQALEMAQEDIERLVDSQAWVEHYELMCTSDHFSQDLMSTLLKYMKFTPEKAMCYGNRVYVNFYKNGELTLRYTTPHQRDIVILEDIPYLGKPESFGYRIFTKKEDLITHLDELIHTGHSIDYEEVNNDSTASIEKDGYEETVIEKRNIASTFVKIQEACVFGYGNGRITMKPGDMVRYPHNGYIDVLSATTFYRKIIAGELIQKTDNTPSIKLL